MKNPSGKPCVMQVITRLIRGGAQEVTVLIVLRLLRDGYKVVLAHGPGEESLLKLLPRDHPDLKILYVPEFRRRILPVLDLFAFLRIWWFLVRYPVDLVHTHTSKAGIIGRWAAACAGVPSIIHSPRGSIYHPTYYGPLRLTFFAFLERLTALITKKIITLNESEKKDYLRHRIAPAEKFTTIYSGIEIKRFLLSGLDIQERKRTLGLPLNQPLVGYVARMTPEKGHELCLDAFEKVLKQVPDAVLVLVGGGPLESQVRVSVARRNLERNVILTGFQSEVEKVLPVFDCCVQTSLWDGLPRAMVEAMIAERAIVATSVGGIPEIIENGKTGILVPEKNADAIAQGVVTLLHHPDKAKQLGSSARRRMEQIFDVDASVEKLFSLYEALISEGRKGRQKT